MRLQRVPGAARAAARTGSVTSTVSSTSTRASRSASSSPLPRGERGVDPAAGLPDPLARLGPGGRGQRADLAVGQRERAAVAGVLEPGLLERVQVGGGGERRERLRRRARSISPSLSTATSTGS